MTTSLRSACLASLILLQSLPVFAQGLTFGIVAKTIDDGNFIETWQGCQQQAQNFGDNCELIGASGPAHIRKQAHALREALASNKYDALAISVIKPDVIAKLLDKTDIPIITFDSPFDSSTRHYSRAYVGTNNEQLGQDLAKLAIKSKPQGGTVCIMTAANDENLAERVKGIRQILNTHGGWTESPRCPWNSSDDISRTMKQISVTLKTIQPDLFIGSGHWPVVDPASYRATVEPYKSQLTDGKMTVLLATGIVTAEQQKLVHEHLVHGYISINFNQIGKQSYDTMKALIEGQTVEPLNYVSNNILSGLDD